MTIEELFEKLNMRFDTLEQGQMQMNARLDHLEENHQELKTRFRGMKMILTRLRKDVSYIIKEFDTRIVQNHRRITKIEHHLGFPQKN